MNELFNWVSSHPIETAGLLLLVLYLRKRQQQADNTGPQVLQEINLPPGTVKYEALY